MSSVLRLCFKTADQGGCLKSPLGPATSKHGAVTMFFSAPRSSLRWLLPHTQVLSYPSVRLLTLSGADSAMPCIMRPALPGEKVKVMIQRFKGAFRVVKTDLPEEQLSQKVLALPSSEQHSSQGVSAVACCLLFASWAEITLSEMPAACWSSASTSGADFGVPKRGQCVPGLHHCSAAASPEPQKHKSPNPSQLSN